jgi:hypothetical protein
MLGQEFDNFKPGSFIKWTRHGDMWESCNDDSICYDRNILYCYRGYKDMFSALYSVKFYAAYVFDPIAYYKELTFDQALKCIEMIDRDFEEP